MKTQCTKNISEIAGGYRRGCVPVVPEKLLPQRPSRRPAANGRDVLHISPPTKGPPRHRCRYRRVPLSNHVASIILLGNEPKHIFSSCHLRFAPSSNPFWRAFSPYDSCDATLAGSQGQKFSKSLFSSFLRMMPETFPLARVAGKLSQSPTQQ